MLRCGGGREEMIANRNGNCEPLKNRSLKPFVTYPQTPCPAPLDYSFPDGVTDSHAHAHTHTHRTYAQPLHIFVLSSFFSRWFHGVIPRKEAEERLDTAIVGTYLFREAETRLVMPEITNARSCLNIVNGPVLACRNTPNPFLLTCAHH